MESDRHIPRIGATYIFELMSDFTARILSVTNQRTGLFSGLIILFFGCFLAYWVIDEWVLLALPFGVLVLLWCLGDFRRLYLLMWATIPLTIEVDLPGGLSTDFPAETLMWLSCLFLPAYLFLYGKKADFRFTLHPIFVILLLHFFWIILATILSDVPLISFKYTLAKTWYLVCFILLPLLLFRNLGDIKQWSLFFVIPLILTVVIIMIRHSQYGFSFEKINNAVIPIYRNHVDYACGLGIILPFVWCLRRWFLSRKVKLFFLFSLALMLAGIYFSYTRAAWLCIPLSVVSFYIIRFKLMRIVMPITLGVIMVVIGWLAYDNTYISFSPDYEKTITHKNFNDVVSATYRLEDISTVERFYRWVAGFYMVREKPFTGFGPGTFYSLYQNYVDRHFTTYVSDNPEHSGMHNYYLMVAVDQGLPGLILFLLLIISVLLYGEKLYHSLMAGPEKELLMAALVSFCSILFILSLNDMVETDKVGSLFFLCIAIVILIGVKQRNFSSEISTLPE
jgi:O-antigen ligase